MKKPSIPTQKHNPQLQRRITGTTQSEVDDTELTLPVTHQRTWLVRYAVTRITDDYATYRDFGLVDAPNIKAAEDIAMRLWVPDAFLDGPVNSDSGEWVNWDGFRAFQLSDQHPDVDSGNIYWIESLRTVDEADAPVLAKYLERELTGKQREAEEEEQVRLRRLVEEEA